MLRMQDKMWKRNGLERLPMMKAAGTMLFFGADLELSPAGVP